MQQNRKGGIGHGFTLLVGLCFGVGIGLGAAHGQTLTSGGNHDGTITANQSNVWTFAANVGDRVVLRDGRLTGAGFNPWMRLYGPTGALIGDTGSLNNDIAHEIAVTATNAGTFTVVMADSAFGGANDVGTYRLFFARLPGAFAVADEGGALGSGANHEGEITIGDMDLWSFAAGVGDRVVLRTGRLSGATFNPWTRIYGPGGELVMDSGAANAQVAQELALSVTNAGTFTVLVTDSNAGNPDDTGSYRLHFFKFPGALSVADDSGALVSGANHDAAVTVGDLDAWTFTARPGDRVLLRAGRLGGDSGFNPWLRLYGPAGELLADSGGGGAQVVQELAVTATNGGPYVALVGDGTSGNVDDTGSYRLCYVKVPGLDVVADDGGRLTNGISATALVQVGDLDVWQFIACRGEVVTVQVDRLTNTNSFDPWLRLYGPTGALVGSSVGAAVTRVEVVTDASGWFTAVVADGGSGGLEGGGDIRIGATGILSDALQLCRPMVSGGALDLAAIGGVPGARFVVRTSTDVGRPLSQWAPLYTNQFDGLGIFRKVDLPYAGEPMRYFHLEEQ